MADDDTSTAPVFDMMTDAERLVAVTRELAAAQVEAATYKERAKSLKEQIKLLNQKPAQPVQGGNTMATSNNTPAQPAPAAPVQATNLNGPGAYTMPNGITVVNVMPASPMVPVAASRSGALLALAFTLCMIVLVVLAGLIVSKYGFSIDTPKAAEVTPPPADKAGDPPAAKADEAKAADEATTPPNDGEKVEAAEQDASMRISCKEFRGDGSEKFLKDMAESWTNLRERCGLAKQAPPASDTAPPASADPAEAPKAIPVDFNVNINSLTIFGGSGCTNGCCAQDKCEKKVEEPPPAPKATCCKAKKPKKVVVTKQAPKPVVETTCLLKVATWADSGKRTPYGHAIDVHIGVDGGGRFGGDRADAVQGLRKISVPCSMVYAKANLEVCFGGTGESELLTVGTKLRKYRKRYEEARASGYETVVLNDETIFWYPG